MISIIIGLTHYLNASSQQYLHYKLFQGMSEDKMDHQDDPKAASRRSRKDQQGRDYVCGCGKRYLSYPALYTHIKTKHDGHQPEGTQKTAIAHGTKRTKPKIDDRILREVQGLVQLENLSILNCLDQNAQGSIPMATRISKQHLSKQLIQAFQSLLKLPPPTPPSCGLDKRSSLDTVLVSYLIGVGQYVSESMYQYYCQFARLFRNCYYDHVQEIYDACFKADDMRKDRVISLLDCRMVPIICDFFLRLYVLLEKKDTDFQAVMELLCLDFCQWMYSHRFTIVEVSLRKSECHIRRNLIEAKVKEKKFSSDNDKFEPEESLSEHQSMPSKNENENYNQEDVKEMINENVAPSQQQFPMQKNEKQNNHDYQQKTNKIEIQSPKQPKNNIIIITTTNNENQIIPEYPIPPAVPSTAIQAEVADHIGEVDMGIRSAVVQVQSNQIQD